MSALAVEDVDDRAARRRRQRAESCRRYRARQRGDDAPKLRGGPEPGWLDSRLPLRFWRRVAIPFSEGGCWLWQGSTSGRGYGQFSIGSVTRPAHRVAYEALVGPIPAGLEPDHLCRNRACVRPDHVEPVTHRENVRRGIGPAAINAAKVVCIRMHAFDRVTPSGRRACRACDGWRRHYAVVRRRAVWRRQRELELQGEWPLRSLGPAPQWWLDNRTRIERRLAA